MVCLAVKLRKHPTDVGIFTGKAWVRSGIHHQRETFLDPGFTLFRTSGGVLRKAPFHRKESSNIVCDAFRPLVVSLLTNGTYAAVSPFRQRAAKNLFRGYLFNGYRRLSSQVGYWIVPVVLGAFPRFLTWVPIGSLPSPPRSCRLLNIRMGQEARRLSQQQGGSHCPRRRALSSIPLTYQ